MDETERFHLILPSYPFIFKLESMLKRPLTTFLLNSFQHVMVAWLPPKQSEFVFHMVSAAFDRPCSRSRKHIAWFQRWNDWQITWRPGLVCVYWQARKNPRVIYGVVDILKSKLWPVASFFLILHTKHTEYTSRNLQWACMVKKKKVLIRFTNNKYSFFAAFF